VGEVTDPGKVGEGRWFDQSQAELMEQNSSRRNYYTLKVEKRE